MQPPGQLSSLSLTGLKSYGNGGTTWHPNFLRNKLVRTTNLSLSTKQLGQWSEEGKQSFSLTENILPTSTPPTYFRTVSRADQPRGLLLLGTAPGNALLNPADDSTLPKVAAVWQTHADTATFVSSASNLDTAKIAALSKIDVAYGMRPKYLRYNLWSSEEEANFGNTSALPCLADWTEYAKPLPRVPEAEFANVDAMKTI